MRIKVVSIDDIILPTNFAMRKIRFIPYREKHISATYKSIAIFIAEIAYLFHRFAVQFIPSKVLAASVNSMIYVRPWCFCVCHQSPLNI